MESSLTPILVPLDGSDLAHHALRCATTVARSARARLLVLSATPALPVLPEPRWYLGTVAANLRRQGLAVEPVVSYTLRGGDAEETGAAILAAARDREAALIVMSTHGRGGLGRWFYGSVSDAVLRHTDVPLLLVPPTSEDAWPDGRPVRILVPLDGSALSETVLEAVRVLADALPIELHLVRAIETEAYALQTAYAGRPVLVSDVADEEQEAQAYLNGVAAPLRATGRDVRSHTGVGFAATVIQRVVREQNVDVVAMATHGRGGLARAVLGSVATQTLRTASVPLLVVRSHAPSLGRGVPATPTVAAPEGVTTVNLSDSDRAVTERALRTLIVSEPGDDIRAPVQRVLTELDRIAMERIIESETRPRPE